MCGQQLEEIETLKAQLAVQGGSTAIVEQLTRELEAEKQKSAQSESQSRQEMDALKARLAEQAAASNALAKLRQELAVEKESSTGAQTKFEERQASVDEVPVLSSQDMNRLRAQLATVSAQLEEARKQPRTEIVAAPVAAADPSLVNDLRETREKLDRQEVEMGKLQSKLKILTTERDGLHDQLRQGAQIKIEKLERENAKLRQLQADQSSAPQELCPVCQVLLLVLFSRKRMPFLFVSNAMRCTAVIVRKLSTRQSQRIRGTPLSSPQRLPKPSCGGTWLPRA